MTTLEDANVGEFIKAATAERPGVATSVGRLRAAYERQFGAINRSVFLAELGPRDSRLSGWVVARWS